MIEIVISMPLWLEIVIITLLVISLAHCLFSDLLAKFVIKKYDLVEKQQKDNKSNEKENVEQLQDK